MFHQPGFGSGGIVTIHRSGGMGRCEIDVGWTRV